jgi:hypothetical protein
VRAEIPRSPAPSSRRVDEEYADDYESGRRRGRGQIFSGLVLLLALGVSAFMYYLTYQTLASGTRR